MSLLETARSGPNFDNLALRMLPVNHEGNEVRVVPNACFARVKPTPVHLPKMVLASCEALQLLDLPTELLKRCSQCSDAHDEFVQHLSGNKIWPGSEPSAHCYCGHQFGSFAGQLGDGAVIYLGEVVNSKGERWELQLKGAGPTPFSRQADGRKVLRSSLREFLCSEAMYHLGIPTTRAVSIITSDTWVERDVFYTGHIIPERASVTSRLAPSFIRFGSFEISKSKDSVTGRQGPSAGNQTIVRTLTEYVIATFYPQIWLKRNPNDYVSLYLSFFEEVVQRTATLVAHWQTVGFCHGVLNTDNMSILGLTIDYGPFGFMDRFMWDHVCNASDTDGHYSYAQQPFICFWNCARLAECLVRALGGNADQLCASEQSRADEETESLAARFRAVLDRSFMPTFQKFYLEQMRRKLGLFVSDIPEDVDLIKSLFDTMELTGADFSNTFLALGTAFADAIDQCCDLSTKYLEADHLLRGCCGLEELREAYQPTDAERQQETLLQYAGIIHHMAERLEDRKVLKFAEKVRRSRLLEHMTDDEKRSEDRRLWKSWLDRYTLRLRIDIDRRSEMSIRDRVDLMRSTNPKIVLRNYMAEQVIRAAESGDYTPAELLFEALRHPFKIHPHQFDQSQPDFNHPPEWARELRIT